MKTNNILGILISLLIGIFVFFIGINVEGEELPYKVYRVYLNGQTIGNINSEQKLLDLINDKQKEIKEKYNVDTVHPPSGLEIEETYTFSEDIISVDDIYDIIQQKDPFTINGYTITIGGSEEESEPTYINVLEKEIFVNAFEIVIKAFTGTKNFELYSLESQPVIVDVGYNVEAIYWEEDITIKEDYINVDTPIFTNENDISKYLLFGTLDEQEHYTVKDGDDISKISYNNNLSVEEFLIANPQFTSENVLLTPGKTVNIALIKPIVTIVSELHVVEDIVNNYKVEYVDDKDTYRGTEKVIQEGEDGITRVTEKILYKNGEIHTLVIVPGLSTEIKPATNKIISRGVKQYSSGVYINTGTEDWYWPTVSPYVITSPFGWRWGKHHNGIDISGSGFGSPIYSSTDGVVIGLLSSCANSGSGYGDTCGRGYGNYIEIKTLDEQYRITYSHIHQNIRVNIGDSVTRGQIIGYMANSGSSTGTHLHFEINNAAGFGINPCRVFGC